MLLIVICWTRESPTESINQTVAVILSYTKINPMKPISIEDLASDFDLLSPELCKLCG